MRKVTISLVLVFIAGIVFTLPLWNGLIISGKSVNAQPSESYDKLWKRVDSCTRKGLSASALDVVEVIYQKAKTENNGPQFVKAVIHRMKFKQYKEEFSLEKNINELEKDVVGSNFPVKNVLQSLLADAYWQYFNNNRWRFYNRTQTISFSNDDIATWDLKTITYRTIKNYKESLLENEKLSEIKIDTYDIVLNKGTSECRSWRPTLYDFLAFRALEFFANTEPDVQRPAARFVLNSAEFFDDAGKFVQIKSENNSDSLETKYFAFETIRQIIAIHLKDKDENALFDADLWRINYVHSNSTLSNKDTLFKNALVKLTSQHKDYERISEVNYLLANQFIQRANKYNPLESDEYKWDVTNAISMAEEGTKQFPKSYGAKQCANLISNAKAKSLNLTIEQVNKPNSPFRALVTSKNINKIYFKIVKTTHHELKRIYRDKWGEKLYNALNKLPVSKTFTQSIEDDNDYQTHNTEIKVPDLPAGYYIILASLNEDFEFNNNITAYAQCISSNLATLEKRYPEGDKYDVYIMDRFSGKRLPNVDVQVWHEKYDYKIRDYKFTKGPKLKSDVNGLVQLSYSTDKEMNNFYLELINGDDHYFNNNSYYLYKPYKEDYTSVQTHFFTDRKIYRPGQTVYFKGIVLERKNEESPHIKANYPVTVTFYDVNYQKVSSLSLTTNEYGSINGSFVAPQGLLNGQMHISDGHGTIYFNVEEYKRPKFEASFKPVAGSYRLMDTVSVTGVAKAFAGNFLDDAKITYRVVRQVRYPYWWWWYRSYYGGNNQTEIANGIVNSNDTGAFIIKFKALPDETEISNKNVNYYYNVLADVTDSNGETHSCSTGIVVGNKSLELSLSTKEIIANAKESDLYINAANLNGVKESAKGNYSVYKLKQPEIVFRNRLWKQPDRHSLSKDEYYKTFAGDLYADELNKFKWEKELIHTGSFDTKEKDKYSLEKVLEKQSSGEFMIEANCIDKNNEEVKAFHYFTYFKSSSTKPPVVTPSWFYSDDNSKEPGEKYNYIISGSIPNQEYLYEIEHKNKIISSSFEKLSTQPKTIDIKEEHRGNISVHASFINNNRFYSDNRVVYVPYTNKELDVRFETFRNKLLPGQKEEWKMIIKNKKGEKQVAEMLACMYDASLDAFASNSWAFSIYHSYYSTHTWQANLGQVINSTEFNKLSNKYAYLPSRYYDRLNYFGLNFYQNYYSGSYDYDDYGAADMLSEGVDEEEKSMPSKDKMATGKSASRNKKSAEFAETAVAQAPVETANAELDQNNAPGDATKNSGGESSGVQIRSNFSETAFFYPDLATNENGEIIIKFTIPESLTKWKFMSLAHTKDLKYGQLTEEVVTQKELMVQPNQPRFFREKDTIYFISKISNLSEKSINGKVTLSFYDAITEKEITSQIVEGDKQFDFSVNKGLSETAIWKLKIPDTYSAIKYRIIANGGMFSDGEEMVIPVLTNRMLVTESMPLPIRSNQEKTFIFKKFANQNNNSTTLKNHSYVLEFTANPAWYAIQALPYIMEYPYECAEQTFSRYYANALASYVVNSKPKIKAVFEAWKNYSPQAFLSNLEKNQELKSLLLEETPWVMAAGNEQESKKRVGVLFDLNRMSNEQAKALRKLKKAQSPNGGFWWFEGGPDDRYITQHIVCGFGHLNKLNVLDEDNKQKIDDMAHKAVKYCDDRMKEDYEWIKKYYKNYKRENHLGYYAVHYLYMRSFYPSIKISNRNQEAYDYFKKQAQTYWLSQSRYMQGMIALSLFRDKDNVTPKDILKSLKENSINSEEMGMYWKENYGYYWYNAPIEMQALMIEAFDEIANDGKSVDDLKTWLIKSKQTQHWGTTKSTTEAVYAMLLRGSDWLSTEPNVTISVGKHLLDPKNDKEIKPEPGTGYFKKTWSGSDIDPTHMGNIVVKKKDEGVSYGAVYWQYFEDLDKITPHETPLKLKKDLFVTRNTKSGPVIEPVTLTTKLKLGDKIKVRIELRVDRDMSYVHMKDMRAAGFEPTNVISSYKWQDGLGYYQSTKDAATNFFFSYLNKGTYVFEYTLLVNHYGNFSNGITTIQCMYAPEFASHSQGIRVNVAK
ncbi:MAG: alpha-2-macroglobulin [Bacteroidia bacterium]